MALAQGEGADLPRSSVTRTACTCRWATRGRSSGPRASSTRRWRCSASRSGSAANSATRKGSRTRSVTRGRSSLNRGELDAAMALLREQERICRELGHRAGLAISLGNQALILQRAGRGAARRWSSSSRRSGSSASSETSSSSPRRSSSRASCSARPVTRIRRSPASRKHSASHLLAAMSRRSASACWPLTLPVTDDVFRHHGAALGAVDAGALFAQLGRPVQTGGAPADVGVVPGEALPALGAGDGRALAQGVTQCYAVRPIASRGWPRVPPLRSTATAAPSSRSRSRACPKEHERSGHR